MKPLRTTFAVYIQHTGRTTSAAYIQPSDPTSTAYIHLLSTRHHISSIGPISAVYIHLSGIVSIHAAYATAESHIQLSSMGLAHIVQTPHL